MSLLEIKGVTKNFGGIRAIKNVGFEVQKDEILGVIGPNGAGKTTLFNLISGAILPNEGRIFFDEQDITRLKPHKICRLGIARTFQITRPFARMSCLENVSVALSERHEHASKQGRLKKAQEFLQLTGLSGKELFDAGQLNLIDKKRLEIARAMATGPQLILLDEPLGGLNSKEMQQALDLISHIRTHFKVTILWIEHIMGAIMQLSHRLIVLDQGELISSGTPEEVSCDPLVIKAYLGEQDNAEN